MNHSCRFTDYICRMGHECSNLEDQILVMDAQDGNSRAMELLVKRWQKRLWNHAYRLTGDSEAAWDVTQSAWYDIIRKLQKLNDPASFRGWAFKITTCKSIDWIKHKARMQPLPPATMDAMEIKSQQGTGIAELIQKLDIKKRAILCLYYFEELSVAEIGAALSIPAGTVKSRLFTARNELKELWNEETD